MVRTVSLHANVSSHIMVAHCILANVRRVSHDYSFYHDKAVCVRKLQSNAYIKRFVSGKTRPRVQFKLDIEFPTETPKPMPPLGLTLNEEPYLAVTTPQSPLIENRESVLTFDDENSENRPIYSPIRAKRSSSGLDESWASFITEDTTKSKDPPSLVFILQPLQDNLTSPFARGTRDPPSFRR